MYVRLSDEQSEFALACRKVLERDCPPTLVRELATRPDGHSAALFAAVADLGWFELAVSDDPDAGGLVELGLAYREAGRFLAPTTIYSTIWAALLLRSAERPRWLDEIGRGAIVLAVAHAEAGCLDVRPAVPYSARAVADGRSWRVTGTKLFVQGAARADHILVAARVEASPPGRASVLVAIPRDAAGVTVTPLATFAGDPQSVIELDVIVDADAVVHGPVPEAEWEAWFGAAGDRACALQCMEMLGGAERVLEDTAAYIRVRHVFGRPVGAFQAAQHHIANLGIAVAAARVAAYQAICAAATDGDASREVSLAKSWLSKTYKDTTVMAHQLFGAIGYRAETDLHLWSQRAKTTEAFFGDRPHHLRRLADALLGPVDHGAAELSGMYIRNHARDTPNAIAIVMAGTGEQLTFAELETRAHRLAHLLRGAGLRAGDHVALLMENHPLFFEIVLAASRLGLYYTPINAHLTGAEAGFVLADSTSRVLFTTMKLLPVATEALHHATLVERALVVDADRADLGHLSPTRPFTAYGDAVGEVVPDEALGGPLPDETLGVAMMYSSGTTGRPKGILRPLPGVAPEADDGAVRMGRGSMKFRPGMILLSPAPLYHAAPHAAAAAVLKLGGTTVVMDRFDAEHLLGNIERHRITHVQLVPTMMARLLKLPEEVRARYDLSSLEVLVHSAAPCPVAVKRAMIDWLGPIVYEYYGATESYGFTRCTSQEWLQHVGTVGRAVSGEIVIVDDHGDRCGPREIGTVWFVTGSRFRYFGAEADRSQDGAGQHGPGEQRPGEGRAAAVTEGSTVDDVGWLDEDGYLYLTDRKTFMIVTGGVNVYPKEIEDVLLEHPAVTDVAVIGIPDDDLGEAVKAVVVLEAGYVPEPAVVDELIAHCRRSLASFKCPRSVDFVASLPRLESGKLAKAQVRDLYWPDRAPSQVPALRGRS